MIKRIIKSIKSRLSGRFSIGRLTVYGNNAMHWGVTLRTEKYGYICTRLPFRSCGRWWPLYWYCSPVATPWAATFMLGHGHDDNWALSRLRKKVLGHNFDLDALVDGYSDITNRDLNYAINNYTGLHACNYYLGALAHHTKS